MEEIRKILEEQKKELLKLKREKEKALEFAPDGILRVCRSPNRVRFYKRTDPKDFNGTYIRKSDFEVVPKLAQKDYDQKILRLVEREICAIERYLDKSPKESMEQIYERLNTERQKLVLPVVAPEAQFVENWESVKYEGKGFSEDLPELYTAKGERVRSKSEVIIADCLGRARIPYRYEYPIRLKGLGMIYPDFTVLRVPQRKEIFWEHLGMMDDPNYAEKALQKIAVYEQNDIFPGEQLILTFETKKNPINQKRIQTLIRRYLQ